MARPSAVRDTSRFSKSAPFSTLSTSASQASRAGGSNSAPAAHRSGCGQQASWRQLVSHSQPLPMPYLCAADTLRYPHDGHATVHCQCGARACNQGVDCGPAELQASRSRGAQAMVKSEALMQEGKIFLGRSVEPEYLELKLANRHGLVTGATGTGKTVSLQVLAEGFSDAGVPVFAADIKGDLSGISQAGTHEGRPRQARQGDRPRRLVQHRLPDRVLGPVRRAGPPHPRHRAGHGAAAAVAPARAQRDAGGRAQHHVPRGGRRGHAAARPEGPARHGQRRRPARQVADDQVRQRRRHLGRRHPAPPAGAGGAGRQQLLRRAGARHQRLHPHRRRTAAASSTSSPPTS